MLLLDIDRALLFALERQALVLEQAGSLAAFAEQLQPIVLMLIGDDRVCGEAAISALTKADIPPERRSNGLYFTLEWLRRLQGAYRFPATLPVEDRVFAVFLAAAQREERRTSGSEAIPLGAIGARARLPAEVVDRAAARAYQEGLIYHSGLDETAYSILLEHEEIEAALATLDTRSVGSTDVATPAVDIGIITFKDEELVALLDVFTEGAERFRGPRSLRYYNLRTTDAGDGETYRIAICRALEQANGEAQSLAREMIDELSPSLLLVVGIAGGAPSSDFTLGDIILSLRVHDYTMHAVNPDSSREYAIGGGPMARSVATHVANLQSYRAELEGWYRALPPQPSMDVQNASISGPNEWVERVRDSLSHHFGSGSQRAPRYVPGVIGSSDGVIKDPSVLIQWLMTARNLLAVEMETAGAYRAATAPEGCAILAIRAVSDIVGLKRDEGWTLYACKAAAAFACAYLRTAPVPPQALASQARGSTRAGAAFAQFYRGLSSPVASERKATLNGIERVLSTGVAGGTALLEHLERIALDRAGARADRVRAIEIMRAHTGVRPRTAHALIVECVREASSALFPTTHDSGPVHGLIHDTVQAIDVLLEIVDNSTEVYELIARDALIAMAFHLRERSRMVGRERIVKWRRFTQAHRDRHPQQAAEVEELIEGDRLGR